MADGVRLGTNSDGAGRMGANRDGSSGQNGADGTGGDCVSTIAATIVYPAAN